MAALLPVHGNALFRYHNLPCKRKSGIALERLLERADKGPYEAKPSGRNRIIWHDD